MTTKRMKDDEVWRLRDLARRAASPGTVSSGHLLRVLASEHDQVAGLLADRGLGSIEIATHLQDCSDAERRGLLDEIHQRCLRLARGCGATVAGGLHLLIALSTLRESVAHQLLSAAGIDLAELRAAALAAATRSSAEPRTELPTTGFRFTRTDGEKERAAKPARDSVLTGEVLTGVALEHGSLYPFFSGSTPSPSQVARDPWRRTRADALSQLRRDCPTLIASGRNLSEHAVRGELTPLVGRGAIVEQVLDVLGKRTANVPCLVGEPGVGKSAIVSGLTEIESPVLQGRTLIEISAGWLVSAGGRRLEQIRCEVEHAAARLLVVLDDFQALAEEDHSLDEVWELGQAMARGAFPCVAIATASGFARRVAPSPALRRGIQPIEVPAASPEEAREILERVVSSYAEHHRVTYEPEALEAVVKLSGFLSDDNALPGRALTLLDLAGSHVQRVGGQQVGRDDVAELVARLSGVPLSQVLVGRVEPGS